MEGLVCSRDSALAPGEDAETRGQVCVDSGTNTDPDWEDQVRTMLESRSKVSQDFNALKLAQQQDELDFNKSKSELQKKKDEAVKQHQALLEKMQSVRVKLQLNNNKAMRKNFQSKIQEMTSERDHAQEERDKLAAELAEVEQQLSSLEEEQTQEQSRWDQELSELRSQTEHAQTEAREAVCRAQRDERIAVERQRDTANERVETWLNQVNIYLSGLRAELPVKLRQEKHQWEKKEAAVKQKQTELQAAFSDLLLRLQRGEDLENLPQIHLPVLPLVPMAELYFHRIMQMTPHLPGPPPTPPHIQAPPPHIQAPPPHIQAPLVHRPAFYPQPFVRPPRFVVTPLPVHAPPPPAQTPPLANAAAAPAPAAAAAFGTLGKLLDKLKVQFPQCSSAELTKLLQQVKTDRGTLAGLSMEDVIERVRQKVEAAPGPAALAPRKPCLMCQKPIDPGAKFELSCAHTLHKECIQVWLKTSKSNNCPFCPNKA